MSNPKPIFFLNIYIELDKFLRYQKTMDALKQYIYAQALALEIKEEVKAFTTSCCNVNNLLSYHHIQEECEGVKFSSFFHILIHVTYV
jgi:hypothetical protein